MASAHVHVDSRDVFVKKLTVKIQHAPITVSVLMEIASARKAGQDKIVQLKIKLQFLAYQHAQVMANSTCTLKNVFANQSSVVMIVRWNFVI